MYVTVLRETENHVQNGRTIYQSNVLQAPRKSTESTPYLYIDTDIDICLYFRLYRQKYTFSKTFREEDVYVVLSDQAGSSTYVGMIIVGRAEQPEKAPFDMVFREVGRDTLVRPQSPRKKLHTNKLSCIRIVYRIHT